MKKTAKKPTCKEAIDFANNIIEEFGEELVHKYFWQL